MKKIYDTLIDSSIIEEAGKSYKFQSALTIKLDNQVTDFTETTILEIVLWKTNRYPDYNNDLLHSINDLKNNYSIEKAKSVLRTLLNSKGFDLPMASTLLRFACPEQLQIIDQRVYRFIMPNDITLKIPYNIEKKIELYFDYIEYLKIICQKYNIPFRLSDRILYQLDKEINSKFPIMY